MTKINIISPVKRTSNNAQWQALSIALVALSIALLVYKPKDIPKAKAAEEMPIKLSTAIELHEDKPLAIVEALIEEENRVIAKFAKENPYRKKPVYSKSKPLKLNQIYPAYKPEIDNAVKQTGLSAKLITAIIWQESKGNPRAVSYCGAKGLMQLMPATAKRFGCTNPFDVKQNISAGARYLKWLDKHFKGNKTKMIAAYNAGEGNVKKYKGIPPFSETQKYVPAVLAHERRLDILQTV